MPDSPNRSGPWDDCRPQTPDNSPLTPSPVPPSPADNQPTPQPTPAPPPEVPDPADAATAASHTFPYWHHVPEVPARVLRGVAADEKALDQPRRKKRMRWPFKVAVLVAFLLTASTISGSNIMYSGYVSIEQGPIFNTFDHIEGTPAFPPAGNGKFLVTTVAVEELTWPRYILALLTDKQGVYEAAGPGLEAQILEGNDREFEEAQRTAAVAATFIGGLAPSALVNSIGAEVAVVDDGSPAQQAGMAPGDVIVRFAGTDIADFETLAAIGEQLPPGTDTDITVVRNDEKVAMRVVIGTGRALGIAGYTAYGPTPSVTFNMPGVQGASAGLMFALTYLDLSTPGDLTAGLVVAGTGSVDFTGQVGEVGGVELKSEAAKQAGADVMFIPQILLDDTEPPEGLVVVGVTSVSDAVSWLCGKGSTSSLC